MKKVTKTDEAPLVVFSSKKKAEEELARVKEILDGETAMNKMIKDAKKRASELLKAGWKIEGYHLVPDLGNRAWTSKATIEVVQKRLGKFADPEAFVSLKTPAKIEAFIKENPKAVEALAKLTEREDKGQKVGKVK